LLISAVYGSRTVDKDGVETQVTGQMPSYVYGGVTPIVLDDELKAGFINQIKSMSFMEVLVIHSRTLSIHIPSCSPLM
jgi:hypothetical protein